MNPAVYKMYCEDKKLVNTLESVKDESDDAELDLLADMKLSLTILDEAQPEYKEKYEFDEVMRQSFNKNQIDFICYQIGDWYLEWKNKMATGEGTQHRLGIAKEHLKELICGRG